MALRIWNGAAADGNFGTAGNYVGGVAPVATDSVLFNQGNVDVTAGLTPGFAIADLTVTPGYGGSIGDSTGAALTFTNITGTVSYAGMGAACRIGCSGTVAAASLSHTIGTFYAVTGTWTLINNTAGNLVIPAATVVTTLQNIAGYVTAEYHATPFTTLTNAGTVVFKRVATTLNAKRGIAIQQDNGSSNYTSVVTANVENGGTYNKQSGGTDTLVTVFPGGNFTTEKNAGGSTGTVTITSTVRWAGGRTKTSALPGVTIVPNLTYVGAQTGGNDSL